MLKYLKAMSAGKVRMESSLLCCSTVGCIIRVMEAYLFKAAYCKFNTGVIHTDISKQSHIFSKRRRKANCIYYFIMLYAEPNR